MRASQQRFPVSAAEYVAADLFDPRRPGCRSSILSLSATRRNASDSASREGYRADQAIQRIPKIFTIMGVSAVTCGVMAW